MRRLSFLVTLVVGALIFGASLFASLLTADAQAPIRNEAVTVPVICDYTALTFSLTGSGGVGDTRPFTTTSSETYLQFAPAPAITTTASSGGAVLLNSTFAGSTSGDIAGTFAISNVNGLAITGSTVSPEARGFMVTNLVVNNPQGGGGSLTLVVAVNFAATTAVAPYYPRNFTGYAESISTAGTYAPYHFTGTISGMMGAPSGGNVSINATVQGKLFVLPAASNPISIGGERALPPLRAVTLASTDYLTQFRQNDLHPNTTLGSESAMSVFIGNLGSFGNQNVPITGTLSMDNHSLLSGNELDNSPGWIVANARVISNLSPNDTMTAIWLNDLPGVNFRGYFFQVAGTGLYAHSFLIGKNQSGAISYEHGRDIATGLSNVYFCSDFQQIGVTPTATPGPPTQTPTPPASCDVPNFGAATSSVVGQDPFAVTTGDFNEDGHTDAAVAVFGLNNVSVLLGNGSGGFSPLTAYPVGSRPVAIAIADLNHDSHTDLITANQFGNNISVLLGNGNGTFSAATNFAVGSLPVALSLGDLNNDNNLDVAVTNTGDNNIAILLGNGSGGFGTPTNTAIGGTPRSVVINDFNNDGNNDMAVANATASNVSVWLGNGTGGFGSPSTFTVGGDPYAIVSGYLNNDGNLDLISANRNTNSVSVLLGNGAGGFGSATDYGVGNGPIFVALGDLNSDGKVDMAVANSNMLNISVRLGNGAGGFGALSNFTVGLNPFAVAIGDLNGDSSPDLITANDSSLDISVLLNNCTLANPSPTVTSTRTATATTSPATATSTSTAPTATGTGVPPTSTTPPATATSTPDATLPVASATPTQPAATGTATLTPVATSTSATTSTALTTVTAISTSTASATTTPPATATLCTLQFTDVPEGSTFYPYVRCLACLGIASGYPDGTYRPQNDVTRGQTSKIVANAAGYDDTIPSTQQTFSDVPPDSTFWLYIERMVQHGVIGGYPDGTFRPGNNATRGQIAKIVSNAASYNDTPAGQTFSDVPANSPFYVWIERLASREIIGGYSDGTFRPGNNATRGQMAKIVSTAFFPDCPAQ